MRKFTDTAFGNFLHRKIARDISGGKLIPELDGLRFFAIIYVLLFHISRYLIVKTGQNQWDPLGLFLSKGYVAIQFLFIVSGFLISLPFAKMHLCQGNKVSIQHYFLRRLSRIEPPYVVNLCICFVLLGLSTHDFSALLPHFLASLSYMHTNIYNSTSTLNTVTWTLEIEFLFYTFAPLMCLLFTIKPSWLRRSFLIGLILLSSALTVFTNGIWSNKYLGLSAIAYLLTGLLSADIYLQVFGDEIKKSYYWDGLLAITLISIFGILLTYQPAQVLLPGLLAFSLFCIFKAKASNYLLRRPLIYSLGGMCYSIYLYHYLVISACGRFYIKQQSLQNLPLYAQILLFAAYILPLIAVVCTTMFILVEKPTMRMGWFTNALKWFRKPEPMPPTVEANP